MHSRQNRCMQSITTVVWRITLKQIGHCSSELRERRFTSNSPSTSGTLRGGRVRSYSVSLPASSSRNESTARRVRDICDVHTLTSTARTGSAALAGCGSNGQFVIVRSRPRTSVGLIITFCGYPCMLRGRRVRGGGSFRRRVRVVTEARASATLT